MRTQKILSHTARMLISASPLPLPCQTCICVCCRVSSLSVLAQDVAVAVYISLSGLFLVSLWSLSRALRFWHAQLPVLSVENTRRPTRTHVGARLILQACRKVVYGPACGSRRTRHRARKAAALVPHTARDWLRLEPVPCGRAARTPRPAWEVPEPGGRRPGD